MNAAIFDIIQKETITPPARVIQVLEDIKARHKDRVLAMVYYGSSLRDLDNPEKMLDFYVLVDSYRRTHATRLRAALNRLIPPAVYYLERRSHEDGTLSTCKYSIMSLSEFEKKCSTAFLSQIWGRFSQPCAMLWAKDDAAQNRVWTARTHAVEKMSRETMGLFSEPVTAAQFWGRGFYESYRTELRPESSSGRSEEIVARFETRYNAITTALYGPADKDGLYHLPNQGKGQSHAKIRWFFRRCLGKPLAAIRILNSAATFEGGLDYILRKVENHSGVKLTPSPAERKHPVLHAPFMFWKMLRAGAFKG